MANILVLVPVKLGLATALHERAGVLAQALTAHEYLTEGHQIEAYLRVCSETGDERMYSGHAAARNAMLDLYLQPAHTHVLWIDADLVEYPNDLATRLHACSSTGIIAPFPLIEGGALFYDTRGFVDTSGRRATHEVPYIEGDGLIPMWAVGCCYLAPAAIFQSGQRYTLVSGETEHYSVCAAALGMGYTVQATRRINVWHANLPKFGEKWH